MAKGKEPKETAGAADSPLTNAAKAVGNAAGRVAALAGAAVEEKPSIPRKSEKIPKLEKKNKSRLPRKEKKAQLKAANRKSSRS